MPEEFEEEDEVDFESGYNLNPGTEEEDSADFESGTYDPSTDEAEEEGLEKEDFEDDW
jgi:hypothetical protein